MKCKNFAQINLKFDPVELTPEYLLIRDELEEQVQRELKIYITRHYPQGKRWGKCHIYWAIKKRILKEKYGIDWQNPAKLNPHTKFD